MDRVRQEELNLKLEQFFGQYPLKELAKNDSVLVVDQPLEVIYFLESGYVRQYSTDAQGNEITLSIFRPGSFFPLNLALHQASSPYSFQALTEVELREAPFEAVKEFVQSDQVILFDLYSRLSSGVNGLLFRLESLMFGTARQKIAASLYLAGQRFGQEREGELLIKFPLTHQHLAFMTGLTRETVSIEMMNLKKDGLIDYQSQQVTLLDPKGIRLESSLRVVE